MPLAAAWTTSASSPQTGSAKPTWATSPSPKKVGMRLLVRSKNWSTTTTSPGLMCGCMEPTALMERIRVTPSFFIPQMFARWLISVGVSRWPTPWRGRNTRVVLPTFPRT